MTDGGPNGASVSLLLLSYKYAFRDFDGGASAAVGVLLAAIIIVLTVLYLWMLRPKKDKMRSALKWRKYAKKAE